MIQFENVLCVSDTHIPYHHPDMLEFLSCIRDKYQPDKVVHTGDITDSYAFSRYPKDPEHDECYTKEFQQVRECVKAFIGVFNDMTITASNHDERLWERAKSAGIPRSVLLPFLEVIGAGQSKWELRDELILSISGDEWYFAHYKGANILRTAADVGMSIVQGHTHTKFSANSITTLRGRIWGVECGCLLGEDRHAFAYNKASIVRPNLGCVLIERGIPRLIPMNLSNSSWDGVC